MRWLFVSALLLLGASTLPVNANGRRTYYSACYTPTYYYPQTYYPSYTPTYTAPAYTAPAAPAYSTDWKEKAVEFAKSQDDYAKFKATMQALGVNYAAPGYSAAEVAYPAQAQTLYGYSYQTVKEAYGSLDVNQLFQTQARLAAGTKEAMVEANAAFASNVGVVTDAQARVQEILAKGKAVEASLIAANAQGSAKSTTTTTVIQPNAVVANVTDPSTQAFLRDFAIPACGSCHSGQNKKGSMDITQWSTFTPQQKAIIVDRITTDDLTKRMPRIGDKPGKLSPDGLRAFLTH